MFLKDFTIPEAEVIYQKAVIRGAWWFLAFLAGCVVVYFVAQKIVQDRKDARYHERQMARIKATEEIGQTSAWAATAKKGQRNVEAEKEDSFAAGRNGQEGRSYFHAGADDGDYAFRRRGREDKKGDRRWQE